MDASFLPATFFTLLVAAEEAFAVLPVQTLINTVVVVVVPEQRVPHGHHGPGTGVTPSAEGCVGLFGERRRKKITEIRIKTNVLQKPLIGSVKKSSLSCPVDCSYKQGDYRRG